MQLEKEFIKLHIVVLKDLKKIDQTKSFDLKNAVNPVRIYFSHYENFLEGTQTIDIPLK